MDKYEGKIKIVHIRDDEPLEEVETFLSDLKNVDENEKLYVSLSKGILNVKKLKKV